VRWLLGSLLVLACAEPEAIRLRLVPTRGLEPERDFERVTLRVRGADGGLVAEATRAGGGGDLGGADALRVGESYRVELIAETRDGVCTTRGRAVGRSLPFTHREGGREVYLQVGCADEMAETRGRPMRGRILQQLTATDEGGAIVTGGTSELRLDGGEMTPEFLREVEYYDPRTGRFRDEASLAAARLLAPQLRLDDGRVVIAGGLSPLFGCESSVEVVWPPGAAPVTQRLEVPRCGSAAFRLRSGVGFFGGAVPGSPLDPPPPNAELHDPGMTGPPRRVVGGALRSSPKGVTIGGGRGALLAPGDDDAAPFELFLDDCGEGPCFRDPDVEGVLPAGWVGPELVYADCPEGGGSVFVVGGVDRSEDPEADETETDRVWCWLDRAGEGTFRETHPLPAPRGYHEVFLANGELIVVGGDEGLRVPIDPCSCETLAVSLAEASFAYPPGPPGLFQESARLDDGTVLVHGGFSGFASSPTTVRGEVSAWLYVPDLEAP